MVRKDAPPGGARHGVARVLSKLGLCSRSEGERRVRDGRVRVNGRVVRDPEFPVRPGVDRVEVDAGDACPAAPLYLALNKPRGLVTTAADERGRDTVYRCFEGSGLPWIAPVGRLDQASEGLLLFSNDPQWAAHLTDPATGPEKTYDVQVDCIPDETLLRRIQRGGVDAGEALSARTVSLLRAGQKNAWLRIVLDEGRNRQIRRLLALQGVSVLRLVRVAIGPLALGSLAKGQWRELTASERTALGPPRAGESPAARERPGAS
jgi:23S rRNA pseudouridine2605 synthase